MRRLCIICEGPTEAHFISACLVPHLFAHGLHAYPSIVRAPSGRHRGGRVTVERLVQHICHEYHGCDRVTTLVDFYGFKDRDGRSRSQLEQAILAGVQARMANFEARCVLPYVQMYEFEGLLFSDIEQFAWVLDAWNEDVRAQLLAVRQAYPHPEDINDGPETAPSKRILAIFAPGAYSKVEHGALVAEAIGLETMRSQCPAFRQWLTALEAWGTL